MESLILISKTPFVNSAALTFFDFYNSIIFFPGLQEKIRRSFVRFYGAKQRNGGALFPFGRVQAEDESSPHQAEKPDKHSYKKK